MRQLFILFPCVLILFVAGCGGEQRPAGMPPLHPTTLTFTQEGAPLADAAVTLFADDAANTQWSFGGTTDRSGVVRIQTQGFNGVPAGTFRIVVSKTETEGTAVVADESSDLGDLGGARPAAAASDGPRSFNLVDAKYRSAATTDLELEVTPGRNAQTFDLGPAVREEIPIFRN